MVYCNELQHHDPALYTSLFLCLATLTIEVDRRRVRLTCRHYKKNAFNRGRLYSKNCRFGPKKQKPSCPHFFSYSEEINLAGALSLH